MADESALRWQLSSPVISFKPHDANDEGVDLKVDCAIQDGSLEFEIEAQQVEATQTPASRFRVRRGRLDSDQCVVEVSEAPSLSDAAFELLDTCQGTQPEGGCVLEGAFDVNGWDFAGTLRCTKLSQQLGQTPISLVDSVMNSAPVTIRLAGCSR